MNRPADQSARTLANAPKQDLRTWLAQMEAAGELQLVRGANREDEIGGIVDYYQRQTNNKAVLLDDIPGFPSGYRAVANILTSTRRIVEAEAALNGRVPSPGVLEAAAAVAAAAIDPLEDVNTSADYRRDLIHAMTRRALDRAAA